MSIALVESQGANTNSGTTAVCTFGTNIALHDAIFAIYVESEASAALSGETVSDTVNSGNYTLDYSYYNSGLQLGIYAYSKTCNASTGKPTVTISGLATGTTNQGLFICNHYNGFTFGPFYVSADTTINTGTGTATTGTGFSNSKANEILFAYWNSIGVDNGTASPGSWVVENTNADFSYWDWLEATSGNSITYSMTQSGSANWLITLMGYIDQAAAGPGPSPIPWSQLGGMGSIVAQ